MAFISMQGKVLAGVATTLVVYLLLVAVGRWLKHRQGVRFGVLYQFFALLLAVHVAAETVALSFPGQEHVLPAVVLFGAAVVFALVRRFLFERYLGETRKILVPTFMIQATGVLLFVATVLGLLQFCYGVAIPLIAA